MAKNEALGRAKDARQDEFYTQLPDIENELRHYRPHFKGKTVLCNCDDPYESNFFKYFALNFNKLRLRKLVATCYSGSPITGTQLSLFGGETEEERRTPYKAVVTTVHDTTGEGGIDMLDVAELFRTGENTIERLEGDGDFRSAECMALLDEVDIVVTNPPFSLIREYITTLVERGKKFIVKARRTQSSTGRHSPSSETARCGSDTASIEVTRTSPFRRRTRATLPVGFTTRQRGSFISATVLGSPISTSRSATRR